MANGASVVRRRVDESRVSRPCIVFLIAALSLAEATSAQGVSYAQTQHEVAANVVPRDATHPEGNALRYGAACDDVTDDSAALQQWLNIGESAGIELTLPEGGCVHTATLRISNASVNGFRIVGVSSGEYVSTSNSAPTRGSRLRYTGSGVGMLVDGGASPKYLEIENVSFIGNAAATAGLSLRRATHVRLMGGAFYGYSNSAAGSAAFVLNSSSGEFVGVVDIERVSFARNYRAVHSMYSSVNVVNFIGAQFHSNTYAIVNGQPGIPTDSRAWNFIGCLFEENDQDILSYGGAQGWNITHSYFEQNNLTSNEPRVHFDANGFSPAHSGIVIVGNVFSKRLQSAGHKLIALEGVIGATIKGNWSAFPIAASTPTSDRYFVDADLSSTNLEIDPLSGVSGATPYPIRVNNGVYATAYDSKPRTTLAATSAVAVVRNTQSNNYTFALKDVGLNRLTVNGGSMTTYTLPSEPSVAWPADAVVCAANHHSTNTLTIQRGTGVAIYLANTNRNLTVAPRSFLCLRRISPNVWQVAENSGGVT